MLPLTQIQVTGKNKDPFWWTGLHTTRVSTAVTQISLPGLTATHPPFLPGKNLSPRPPELTGSHLLQPNLAPHAATYSRHRGEGRGSTAASRVLRHPPGAGKRTARTCGSPSRTRAAHRPTRRSSLDRAGAGAGAGSRGPAGGPGAGARSDPSGCTGTARRGPGRRSPGRTCRRGIRLLVSLRLSCRPDCRGGQRVHRAASHVSPRPHVTSSRVCRPATPI